MKQGRERGVEAIDPKRAPCTKFKVGPKVGQIWPRAGDSELDPLLSAGAKGAESNAQRRQTGRPFHLDVHLLYSLNPHKSRVLVKG
jgi:hypothetical protein